MATLRKLKNVILGRSMDLDKASADLAAAGVPTSDAACRACGSPCEDGHEDWPRGFKTDMETPMLGSVKGYARQVVISTGKSDWAHEVSEEAGTLAYFLDKARPSASDNKAPAGGGPTVEGVFAAAGESRVSVLNGSLRTLAEDAGGETVLVFPDYTLVAPVPTSLDGARALWAHSLSAPGEPIAAGGLETKVLPYACVILLCSHKKRDNRCHIAAPRLEAAFTGALERRAYAVDTQLDAGLLHEQAPLERGVGDADARAAELQSRRHAAAAGTLGGGDTRRVLIVRNSHMGGHKFAGNVIIYTPTGTGVWYGRVSTHEVETVVESTIVGGKVLPPLLRGGVNLARPGCNSLHDW